jgi:hypothetical protein
LINFESASLAIVPEFTLLGRGGSVAINGNDSKACGFGPSQVASAIGLQELACTTVDIWPHIAVVCATVKFNVKWIEKRC